MIHLIKDEGFQLTGDHSDVPSPVWAWDTVPSIIWGSFCPELGWFPPLHAPSTLCCLSVSLSPVLCPTHSSSLASPRRLLSPGGLPGPTGPSLCCGRSSPGIFLSSSGNQLGVTHPRDPGPAVPNIQCLQNHLHFLFFLYVVCLCCCFRQEAKPGPLHSISVGREHRFCP